jgi:hypothetical protein
MPVERRAAVECHALTPWTRLDALLLSTGMPLICARLSQTQAFLLVSVLVLVLLLLLTTLVRFSRSLFFLQQSLSFTFSRFRILTLLHIISIVLFQP